MPFLVDSLTMELSRQLRDVHVVIHPQLRRRPRHHRRAAVGACRCRTARSSPTARRSASRGCTSRSTGSPRATTPTRSIEEHPAGAARRPGGRRGLGQDARPGRGDRRRARAPTRRRSTPRRSARPRRCSSGWPTTTSPSSATASTSSSSEGDDELLRAVPGTGLGILRADQDMSASFGKLPDAVKAKAREKTLLVLAKANSRATVHRPAYLDYVGVKKFDENGEVVGERRFLGLFSSAAYTESLTRIPLLREKAAAVLKRSGFDPRSHAGKALMDTLETYPRDELFHTPVDELAPMAEAAMHARERRQVRMFIRRDTYGRYVSVLVYLPRDRYNTSVRERFAQILKEQPRRRVGRVHRPASTSPTTARVHFVVHPPKGGDDPRGRHRRPRAPAHRGLPLLARRLHPRRDRGVRRGGRRPAGPPLRRLVPRGLQGGLLRRAPARSTSAGSRRSTGRRGGIDLSLYEHARRRPRRGSAQGLPGRPAAVAVRDPADALARWASRSSTSAPTSSTGWSARRSSTSSACATAGRCPTQRPRAVPGRAARGVGRLQRDRRLQRAGARRRADLAAGDRAARVREVHAAGQHARSRSTTSRTRCAATSTSPGCWCRSSRRGSTRANGARRRRRGADRRSRRSRSGSPAPSTTWPASTTTGSCAPT